MWSEKNLIFFIFLPNLTLFWPDSVTPAMIRLRMCRLNAGCRVVVSGGTAVAGRRVVVVDEWVPLCESYSQARAVVAAWVVSCSHFTLVTSHVTCVTVTWCGLTSGHCRISVTGVSFVTGHFGFIVFFDCDISTTWFFLAQGLWIYARFQIYFSVCIDCVYLKFRSTFLSSYTFLLHSF